jgi:hypothetical protein
MSKYAISGANATTATPFDSALSVIADATRPRRGRLVEFTVGADGDATPADVQMASAIGRITAEGTQTDVAPVAIDPGSPVTEADAGEDHTVEPTYTAASEVFRIGRHMRATYRWVAAPGAELVWPATAANGLGFRSEHASATHIERFHAIFEE